MAGHVSDGYMAVLPENGYLVQPRPTCGRQKYIHSMDPRRSFAYPRLPVVSAEGAHTDVDGRLWV